MGKRSSAIFTESRNTLESDECCLLDIVTESHSSDALIAGECLTQTMLSHLVDKTETGNVELKSPEEATLLTNSFVLPLYLEDENMDEEILNVEENIEEKEQISKEALQYIAGYVAYRFKNKYNIGTVELLDTAKAPDWLRCISRGSLLYPTEELLQVGR